MALECAAENAARCPRHLSALRCRGVAVKPEAPFDDRESLIEHQLQRPRVALGVPGSGGGCECPNKRRGDHLDLERVGVAAGSAGDGISDELGELVDQLHHRGLKVRVFERVVDLAADELLIPVEERGHHGGDRAPYGLNRRVRCELLLDGAWLWTALALTLRTPTLSRSSDSSCSPRSPSPATPSRIPAPCRRGCCSAVQANPISHLIEAERGLMHGQTPDGQIAWVLVASAVLLAVFAPLTAHLYRRG